MGMAAPSYAPQPSARDLAVAAAGAAAAAAAEAKAAADWEVAESKAKVAARKFADEAADAVFAQANTYEP